MRYLITYSNSKPFFTNYFTVENCWNDGMIVYDLVKMAYTTNGKDWNEIVIDLL